MIKLKSFQIFKKLDSKLEVVQVQNDDEIIIRLWDAQTSWNDSTNDIQVDRHFLGCFAYDTFEFDKKRALKKLNQLVKSLELVQE